MRDYSKVSSVFWTGKTGKSLRGDMQAQVIAMYLLTSPHANMIGVFHCPIIYMAYETGSPIEGASKGLQTLIEGGFCSYDEDEELVWVHNMAKHQIGDELAAADKRVKSIQKQYGNLPECRIKQGFYEKYKAAFNLVKNDTNTKPLPSPSEAPSKPETGAGAGAEDKSAKADTQKADKQLDAAAATGTPSQQHAGQHDFCPHNDIIALYAKKLPMGTQVREWTAARQQMLKARWREKPERQSLDWWEHFFGYVAESDFLTGKVSSRGSRPFTVSLPWLCKSENFAKVLEGQYENKGAEVAA